MAVLFRDNVVYTSMFYLASFIIVRAAMSPILSVVVLAKDRTENHLFGVCSIIVPLCMSVHGNELKIIFIKLYC